MSPEVGGRSDKFGNEYENRCLAKQLLRLVLEKTASIVVEPLGPEGDGVEFVVTELDGCKTYYQCKASNVGSGGWSLSDLNRHRVFDRAKAHIESSPGSRYVFMSPLNYSRLDELCRRARSNCSATEFCTLQAPPGSVYAELFAKCARYFCLDKDKPEELNRLVCILAHCSFEVNPYGNEALEDLNEQIGLVFTGNCDQARLLLEHIVVDRYRFGVSLTSADVVRYMEENNVQLRSLIKNSMVLPRIQALNDSYWGEFRAINNKMLHRPETDEALEALKNGRSIIIHGKAGSGKSGCVEELRQRLSEENILFLGIKLDKMVPSVSADTYGQSLGLPQSPVFCLSEHAAGRPCVLILDQLDCLRWTSAHSATALDVCKEMISQALSVNRYENGKVSVVLVSRTFDLENDSGLRDLTDSSDSRYKICWVKICVDALEPQVVEEIIGSDYQSLTERTRKMLTFPSSLYVWCMLDRTDQKNNIKSVYELMNAWWQDILSRCERAGAQKENIVKCKDAIVDSMNTNAVFVLPESMFIDRESELSMLESCCLIARINHLIAFVHQSFLDYFIAADAIRKIYAGGSIVDIIGSQERQIPNMRYRVLLVLQNLIDSDRRMFLKQCRNLLTSENVRYYYKCTVFEVIGQCTEPDKLILAFTEEQYQIQEWQDCIIRTVYLGHPAFVMPLEPETWLVPETLGLLGSVSDVAPDFVVEKLRPYAFESEQNDKLIYCALCMDPTNDSEDMFSFRMELLRKHPTLLNNLFSVTYAVKSGSQRAVPLLLIGLQNRKSLQLQHSLLCGDDELGSFSRKNHKEIIEVIFPEICRQTEDCIAPEPYYEYGDERRCWISSEYNEGMERIFVTLAKTAFNELALKEPNELIRTIDNMAYSGTIVQHEIIMYALLSLPVDFSDFVVNWLLEDFGRRVFVYSDSPRDYLCCSKEILKKFSPHCSNDLFNAIEEKIYYWKDQPKRMSKIYELRIERNRVPDCAPSYIPFWGHFQKEMLPTLDSRRISRKGKELLQVLGRNANIDSIPYYHGFYFSEGGPVLSPIDGHTGRLSDKSWIKIISTPNERMNKGWIFSTRYKRGVEATHPAFASSLSTQAKAEPARFAKLSLSFPENCYAGYIRSVLYALREYKDGPEKPTDSLIVEVVKKYCSVGDSGVALAVADLVGERADIHWSEEVLDSITRMALDYSEPEVGENDPHSYTAQQLLDKSLNCVRSCAVHTISKLIWNHIELAEKFMPIISRLRSDGDEVVRFALGSCVLACYNVNAEFTVRLLKQLADKDIRIIAFPDIWEVISREYKKDPAYFRKTLLSACGAEDSELRELAAASLCAASVFYEDDLAMEEILTRNFDEGQQGRICIQAMHMMEHQKDYPRSMQILEHFLEITNGSLPAFSRLFYSNTVRIKRDKGLLMSLARYRCKNDLPFAFLDHLKDIPDNEICEYAEIVEVMTEALFNTDDELTSSYELKILASFTLRAYDMADGNEIVVNACLNIWDTLFKCNKRGISAISEMIDNAL